MGPINMREARSRLSALVAAVESGREAEVVIARKGKPVARLIAMGRTDRRPIFGLARGEFTLPDDRDKHDGGIAALFNDGPIFSDEQEAR